MSWYLRCNADTTPKQAALMHLAESSCTRQPRDLAIQAMLVREGGIGEVLAARASWLTWLTLTQRDWQAKATRRPARARHHDSIEIRERYVRCH